MKILRLWTVSAYGEPFLFDICVYKFYKKMKLLSFASILVECVFLSYLFLYQCPYSQLIMCVEFIAS